jgi:hypothetical protein
MPRTSLKWTFVVVLCAAPQACDAGNAASSGPTLADSGADATAPGGDAGAAPAPSDAAPGTSDAQTPASIEATFRTLDTGQYLSAGAGGTLSASANAAGPSERFALTDVDGGPLADGDPIHLALGGAYLTAVNGGGGALTFSAAAAGDDETFLLVRVDGPGAIAAGDHVALKTKVTGNYVSAIQGGGGMVLANAPWDRAWETFTLGVGITVGDAGASDADSGASSARQKVLAFLAGISGKESVTGVEDKDSYNPHADSDRMASMAGNGQSPSFWSADWGFGGAADPAAREAIVQEGIRQWQKGAIVQYIYHACPLGWGSNEGCDYQNGPDPIKGSYGQLSDAQWTDLTTQGGALNKVWLARLDVLAGYFQELKAAGVAPLFRPLHEINATSANGGGWAWWQGRAGATGSALLYEITHDYLVDTKGLDNIVWVWNLQDYTTLAADVNDYKPADFDIAALDVYNTGYTQGNYDAMVGGGGGKPIGIAECRYLPSTGVLAQQPLWTYAVMWPDFFADNTSAIPALFGDPQVLPLSKMPGW